MPGTGPTPINAEELLSLLQRSISYGRGLSPRVSAVCWVEKDGDDTFIVPFKTDSTVPPPVVEAAPNGLRVPALGFGGVWSSIEGVKAAIGYAQTDEQQASLATQRFQGGTILVDFSSGQVFVFYGDSTLAGPFS